MRGADGGARIVTFWDSIDPRIRGVESAVPLGDADADPAERRAREFRAGRFCARAAIGALPAAVGSCALPFGPIEVGPSGAPAWPVGIVGSISHAAGRVVAAVTSAPGIRGLGVDIERARVFDPQLTSLVCRPDDELAAAGDLGPSVAFGAKESVFKAWSPVTGGWLEFEDIRVRLRSDGCFDVLVVADELVRPGSWSGRWRIEDGFVRTAAVWNELAGG